MTDNQIRTIGNFLGKYAQDLNFILCFQRFKAGEVIANDYLGMDWGFNWFLIDFKVARNVALDNRILLLNSTLEWINGDNPDNVDAFAVNLAQAGITYGIARSLCSKILFLNNPWQIYPMDGRNLKAVGLTIIIIMLITNRCKSSCKLMTRQ